jgi:hypothetical protein
MLARNSISVLLILALLTIFLTMCGTPSTPPQVSEIIANPTTVVVGGSVILVVNVSASNPQYKWTAVMGTFENNTIPAVRYTAPSTPGTDTVTVAVTSGGLTVTRNVSIIVVPNTNVSTSPVVTPTQVQSVVPVTAAPSVIPTTEPTQAAVEDIQLTSTLATGSMPTVAAQAPTQMPEPPTESTITPQVTPSPNKTIIFQDDFESGNADSWESASDSWTVIQDDTGNHIFQGSKKDDWTEAFPRIASTDWNNYAVEIRFRVVQMSTSPDDSDVHINFRQDHQRTQGCRNYVSYFDIATQWTSLSEYGTADCDRDLVPGEFPAKLGEWYKVRVEAANTALRLYIEDKLILETSDATLSQGDFSIEVAPGAIVQFDDVSVWSLEH